MTVSINPHVQIVHSDNTITTSLMDVNGGFYDAHQEAISNFFPGGEESVSIDLSGGGGSNHSLIMNNDLHYFDAYDNESMLESFGYVFYLS